MDVNKRPSSRNIVITVFAIVILVAAVGFGVMRSQQSTGNGSDQSVRPTPPKQNNLGADNAPAPTPDLLGTDPALEAELSNTEALGSDTEELDALDDLDDIDLDF